MNELAIFHQAGKGDAVHPSERAAQVCRVRETRAMRGFGKGFSLNGELDSGHQAQPKDIAPEWYANLFGEQMHQAAFGKTSMPRKFSDGHLPGEIFSLQQAHGGLYPWVNRFLDMPGIAV